MKISVIIPTYKPQDYIWECLDSLTKQTFDYKSFEIIIVLNGCCEPWKSELETYIEANMSLMNVKLVQTDQGGVSNARNIGLNNANGEYVTFIDDDDYISPSYLEELYSLTDKDTIALCYPYAFKDENPEKQMSNYKLTEQYDEHYSKGKLSYHLPRAFFAGPCMKLIPAKLIRDRRFNINFCNGEDSLFMFQISDRFNYVHFTSKQAVYFRRYRSLSAVTSPRPRSQKILNGLKLILEYSKIYFKAPSRYSFKFYFTRILASFHSMIV
jgi:glycosyltransferase involved in cell wall biosynthesis